MLFVGPDDQQATRRALLLRFGSLSLDEFALICHVIAILSACLTEEHEHAFTDVLGTAAHAFYSGGVPAVGSFLHSLVEAAVVTAGENVRALDALSMSLDKSSLLALANADWGDGAPSIRDNAISW